MKILSLIMTIWKMITDSKDSLEENPTKEKTTKNMVR